MKIVKYAKEGRTNNILKRSMTRYKHMQHNACSIIIKGCETCTVKI